MAALLLLAGGCTARDAGIVTSGDIQVHGGFAFAPPTTSEAAGYFTIVNRGAGPDTLLTLTSSVAAGAMLHGQVQDGGMVRMVHLEAPLILARDSLVLSPGGTHLMLMTLEQLPKQGDSLPVTLTFARAGTVTVMLPVRAYGDAP
jgi:hypothetical protein